MSPPDAPDIYLFGDVYPAGTSSIQKTHTVSIDQARRLDREFDECRNLQEAIRAATERGIRAREQEVTKSDVDRIVDHLAELEKVAKTESKSNSDPE